MSSSRKKPRVRLDMDFEEALRRFAQTSPREVVEAISEDILKQQEQAQKHIERARKELKDGARPKKGRFRL